MFMANLQKGCGTVMSSFLTVNLDTTKPSVEIYAPNYVATNSIMEVLIVANEDLDIYQDVQMVYGDISIPLIFSQENNKLKGLVSLHGVPEGILEISVQVRDVVHNLSDKVVKTVNALENKGLKLESKVSCQEVKCNHKSFSPTVKITPLDIKTKNECRNLKTAKTIMKQAVNAVHVK